MRAKNKCQHSAEKLEISHMLWSSFFRLTDHKINTSLVKGPSWVLAQCNLKGNFFIWKQGKSLDGGLQQNQTNDSWFQLTGLGTLTIITLGHNFRSCFKDGDFVDNIIWDSLENSLKTMLLYLSHDRCRSVPWAVRVSFVRDAGPVLGSYWQDKIFHVASIRLGEKPQHIIVPDHDLSFFFSYNHWGHM